MEKTYDKHVVNCKTPLTSTLEKKIILSAILENMLSEV